ncbi:hypothetical protein [Planktothrix paucivesiculata]|nr:hypothetical protein [Planktothrix paucivesiculata]
MTEKAATRFQEMIMAREKALSQPQTTVMSTSESKPKELELV